MAKKLETLKTPSTWMYLIIGWLIGLLFSPGTLVTWVKGFF